MRNRPTIRTEPFRHAKNPHPHPAGRDGARRDPGERRTGARAEWTQRAPRSSGLFGAGFGHGLGLSQWGSYGLAKQGWGPTKILKHFYSGTRVAREARPPKNLRIGLAQGEDSVRLEAQAGPVEIRLGDAQIGVDGRDDPLGRDVEGRCRRQRVPDRRCDGNGRGPRRQSERPDLDRVRAVRRPRSHPERRTHVQPRLDRVRPVLVLRRLCDAAGPHGGSAGLPVRAGRGPELVADVRPQDPGDRGEDVRVHEGRRVPAPGGLRLRAVRELVRPGVRRVGQGGRRRRRPVGRRREPDRGPGRAERRADDPSLLHVLLGRVHGGQRERVGWLADRLPARRVRPRRLHVREPERGLGGDVHARAR